MSGHTSLSPSSVIALTGITGLVGQTAAKRLLDDGYYLRALCRTPEKVPTTLSQYKTLEIVPGDILNTEDLKTLCHGAQTVVHCAGLTKSLSHDTMRQANGYATQNFFKIAENAGVKRFLYISSLAARMPDLSHYAKSKFLGEQGASDIIHMGWDILRPPAIYGPEDHQILAFFKMIQSGLVFIPSTHKTRFSMIYIDDMAAAIHAWVAARQSHNRIYEITGADQEENESHHNSHDNTGLNWSKIIPIAANILRSRPICFHLPKAFIYLFAWGCYLLGQMTRTPQLITPDKIKELRHINWVADGTDFESDFDWSPKTNIRTGFEKTIHWYKQHNLLKP